jgi:tetratricopeptide (TPR) repeat protein
MQDVLKKATLKNKQNAARTLPTGQTLDIGSYLIVKDEGLPINQQNVFGFIAQGHTCAEIHLSRTLFKEGEEHLFDAVLDSFAFDPAYIPTPSDYKLMAKLLPPGMAAAYKPASEEEPTSAEPQDAAQSLTFALPSHPGLLHIDAPNFVITELSAKSNGSEFGIRAKDKTITGAEALGFLFLTNPSRSTAIACRDWMLAAEQSGGVQGRKILKLYESVSASGVPIALVDYEQTKAPATAHFVRRFFAAQGDLCLDLAVTAENPIMAETTSVLFKSLTFDPNRPPDFIAKFRYATVLYDHHAYATAAPIYESALTLVDTVPESTKWRRVTTDQASMAYGIAGDLKHSRALNEAAILKDPDYPLYYYNLACADAEAGDATAARTRLQQAYARRANTLPGESLPDASNDDSILKLKGNKEFWAFVQSLSTGKPL